jgi:hypothetical protein
VASSFAGHALAVPQQRAPVAEIMRMGVRDPGGDAGAGHRLLRHVRRELGEHSPLRRPILERAGLFDATIARTAVGRWGAARQETAAPADRFGLERPPDIFLLSPSSRLMASRLEAQQARAEATREQVAAQAAEHDAWGAWNRGAIEAARPKPRRLVNRT